MPAVLIDMEIEGDFLCGESAGEADAVFGQDTAIGGGVPEEAWGSIRFHLEFGGELFHEFRTGIFPEKVDAGSPVRDSFFHGDDRVAENAEVRPGADAVDGIGGVRISVIEAGQKRCGEMSAGGGPDHADSFGVDTPLFRVAADDPERAGRIGEHHRVTVSLGAETVAQDESGDAVLIEEERVIASFMTGCKTAVSASGTDQNCGNGLFFLFWEIGLKGRDIVRLFSLCEGSIPFPESHGSLGFGRCGGGVRETGDQRGAEESCAEKKFHPFFLSFFV